MSLTGLEATLKARRQGLQQISIEWGQEAGSRQLGGAEKGRQKGKAGLQARRGQGSPVDVVKTQEMFSGREDDYEYEDVAMAFGDRLAEPTWTYAQSRHRPQKGVRTIRPRLQSHGPSGVEDGVEEGQQANRGG